VAALDVVLLALLMLLLVLVDEPEVDETEVTIVCKDA
jgi:hypothetical protein